MATVKHDEIAHELMEDFFQDFSEAHEQCEHVLIALEQSPDDPELLNTLFRNIHSVKGNLVYVGLKDITPLLQSIEDILDALRKHRFHYDALLSDVILLALDKTQAMVDARVTHKAAPLQESSFDELCQLISRIAELDTQARTDAIRDALTVMDPNLALTASSPLAQQPPPPSPVIPAEDDLKAILRFFAIEIDHDIQFFTGLCASLEARSHFWEGRTIRQMRLALAMNKHAGEPVEPAQLAVAVILHDTGMAFLPVELLHNSGSLKPSELNLLRSHPHHGHALLAPMQRWAAAAQAILQHHERVDGNGYPAGITGEQISHGAKILAIVDTFEARTHERAHSHLTKRPFVRAILEINSCAGSQFDPEWVEVFNQVARAIKA